MVKTRNCLKSTFYTSFNQVVYDLHLKLIIIKSYNKFEMDLTLEAVLNSYKNNF